LRIDLSQLIYVYLENTLNEFKRSKSQLKNLSWERQVMKEEHLFVSQVKARYPGVGYPLREMTKANRQGQYSCSGIWWFLNLISSFGCSSYLVSTFYPIYNFFVFAFLSSMCYSYCPTHSTVQLVLFPYSVNNSSINHMTHVPPQ
jgi:hypothetical protein